MLNLGEEIGKEPDPQKIFKLIKKKKEDLERMLANMTKKQIVAKDQLKKLKK